MALYLGRESFVGFGEESTWGTAVSRTRWARVLPGGLGIRRDRPKIPVPDLGTSGATYVPRQFFVERDRVSGTLRGNASYDEQHVAILLKHALGQVATSGVGPYTHTLSPELALPAGLTIEKGVGPAAGSDNYSEVFEGCKVNRLTLDVAFGGLMTWEADIVGETSGGATTRGTPTLGAAAPVYVAHHHGATLLWNSVAYSVKSARYVIDNKLAERDKVGSLNTLEPQRSGPPEIVGEFTIERVSNALQAGYLAETQSDAVIVFTDPVNSYTMTWTITNALITEYDTGPDGWGPVEDRVKFTGFRDASKEGGTVVIVNANSTAV
jgi:hypothetical protein